MSNPGNVAGGHKANLNNPNTSEESKQHSRDVLENQLDGGDVTSASDANKNPNNVQGGIKAAINNPNTSVERKEELKSKLDY
nr:hypothetical protein B0A51_03769 [Rachicladosporium sp. CCFEE 5018]